ncbi:MAG: DUF4037 domain-containing protein [Chloroflexota bacterium]|nr:DUF4037 domain-containing protein [Chloroflexota bacterium]
MPSASPPFIPGLALNRQFYAEVVRPLLDREVPDLVHSAALMGSGSDVLGFDTATSTDHNWGPRLQLFLPAREYAAQKVALDETLQNQLPPAFRGFSVNFSQPDMEDGGTQRMETISTGPVRHLIEIETIDSFFQRHLGVTPGADLNAIDWLLLSEQSLLEMTEGQVFHDGLGSLLPARERFDFYPRDVWLYRMAAQWQRLSQEEAFLGRCGDVGDDLGSRIVTARLVRDMMRLAFLMQRRYAPYSKWLGSAFSRLALARELLPLFEQALQAEDWQSRQRPVAAAYSFLAERYNALQITPPIDPSVRDYFGRPYLVIFAERFSRPLQDAISDQVLKGIPLIGAIDQFADSTDLTDDLSLPRRLRVLYTQDPS